MHMRLRRKSDNEKSAIGRVRLDDGYAREVTILDHSKSGLRIVLEPSLRIPEEFVIELARGDQMRRARVKWRTATELGAQFV